MKLNEFKLERYFAKYEFRVKYLFSPSDCESVSLAELLSGADRESLELWQELKLGYTESQGHPVLRAEAAKLYQALTPDDLIVANPEEAIFFAMQALLEKGDEVIIVDPAYQSLFEIPRSIGCRVTKWPLYVKDGAWSLDLDFLKQKISPKTRLIVVNFPHNPTGYLPAAEEFAAILELAGKNGAYLFSDEIYRFLEHDPSGRLPPAADLYERGISLFGLSKTFGLPGLRIGWLATGDKELMRRFTVLKDYTSICSSAPSEILSIIALRSKERLIERNRAIIRDNLIAAGDFFQRHAALFRWYEPQGGSIAFPALTGKRRVADFCREVVERQNVMILPGDVFNYPGNHFRVGLGRKDFPAACRELDDYLGSVNFLRQRDR